MRNRDVFVLLFIVVLTGLALWVNFAPGNRFLGRDVHTRLGLDLQGGIQVLLRARQEQTEVSREEMQIAAGVIERRVNALGVGETVVQLSGNDRVIVELPGVANPDQAIETLRGTGRLEFIDPQGQFLPPDQTVRTTGSPNPPALQETAPLTETGEAAAAAGLIYESITDGRDLDTSEVQPAFSQGTTGLNEPAVAFAFTNDSARQLAQFTAQNVGQPMCIVLDNVVVSCPVINDALTDGSGVITTNTVEDRDRIYNQLKFGALPVALEVETSRTVSATLGADSVRASLVAGIVGMTIVALFMIIYYRLPGVLAVVALLIYTALSFAIYRLVPVTLTLAGIAGFILSIGLAVDANVLIFSRIKEELRRKRDLRTAIESGFVESWPAIRDSSVSTLITSFILYMFGNSFGVSIIKGFALTLGLGITLSLFMAMVVTRTFLRLIATLDFARNRWLFAVEHEVSVQPAAAYPAPASSSAPGHRTGAES